MSGPTRSRRDEARDDLGFWHGVVCLLPLAAALWGLIAGATLRWLV